MNEDQEALNKAFNLMWDSMCFLPVRFKKFSTRKCRWYEVTIYHGKNARLRSQHKAKGRGKNWRNVR